MNQPYICIDGVCAFGWFSKRMTLRQFALARSYLEKLDVCLISIYGPLA